MIVLKIILIFHPIYVHFKKIPNTEHISSQKTKRLFDEIIKTPNTSDNSLALALIYTGSKTRVKFDGGSL